MNVLVDSQVLRSKIVLVGTVVTGYAAHIQWFETYQDIVVFTFGGMTLYTGYLFVAPFELEPGVRVVVENQVIPGRRPMAVITPLVSKLFIMRITMTNITLFCHWSEQYAFCDRTGINCFVTGITCGHRMFPGERKICTIVIETGILPGSKIVA